MFSRKLTRYKIIFIRFSISAAKCRFLFYFSSERYLDIERFLDEDER